MKHYSLIFADKSITSKLLEKLEKEGTDCMVCKTFSKFLGNENNSRVILDNKSLYYANILNLISKVNLHNEDL